MSGDMIVYGVEIILKTVTCLKGTVFQGIREVFEKATQAALQQKKKKKNKCIIL